MTLEIDPLSEEELAQEVQRARAHAEKKGIITGVSGPHILVKLDDAMFSLPYHPVWGMRYLDQESDGIPDRRQTC